MKLAPLFATASLLLTACIGSAQVQFQDARGGVLALKGMQDKAMEDAHRQMSAHCGPGNYEIMKQERIVVGHETTNNTYQSTDEQRDKNRQANASADVQEGRDRYGNYASADVSSRERERERANSQTQGQSRTVEQDVKEMHITYQCGHGSAQAAAPAPVPPPPPPAPAPRR